MKRRYVIITLCVSAVILGSAGLVAVSLASRTADATAGNDPRTAPRLVKIVEAKRAGGVERAFTGTIAARVQSNLGFRVPGKITERLVDVGQQVRAGQPLMRIDETDLSLALTAKRNAVAAARAVLVQASADEKRYAVLVQGGLAATPQRYEQAKAALDTAQAQFDAAAAEAKVAENATAYSTLVADADGTIVATLGEPGQVVAAGQTVVQLAHAGPREAMVALPETVRPALGSAAEATVFGNSERRWKARLRQISDAADTQTRTYEARYVLESEAGATPLGATVTIRIADHSDQTDAAVPVGAVLDDGSRTGVWAIDFVSSTVRFVPVKIKRLGDETAVVSGVKAGDSIVGLGASLLREGERVKTSLQPEAMKR